MAGGRSISPARNCRLRPDGGRGACGRVVGRYSGRSDGGVRLDRLRRFPGHGSHRRRLVEGRGQVVGEGPDGREIKYIALFSPAICRASPRPLKILMLPAGRQNGTPAPRGWHRTGSPACRRRPEPVRGLDNGLRLRRTSSTAPCACATRSRRSGRRDRGARVDMLRVSNGRVIRQLPGGSRGHLTLVGISTSSKQRPTSGSSDFAQAARYAAAYRRTGPTDDNGCSSAIAGTARGYRARTAIVVRATCVRPVRGRV